jgi:hypothetical protein
MKIVFSSGRHVAFNAAHVAFLLVACLTALNGFVDSLWYQFMDSGDPVHNTFLYDPTDNYGDLLKPSFAAPPFSTPDFSNWPPFMVKFYVDNPYARQTLNPPSHIEGLSFLHVPPITLMVHIIAKKVLLMESPQFVVMLFYDAAVFSLFIVCFVMTPTRLAALGTFLILWLSYPFLMIVSRGNIGALADGATLLLFFHFILGQPRFWAAVSCLATAAAFHPNVLFLSPILLCFGIPRALLGAAVAGAALLVVYALFFYLDGLFYPGYGPTAHWAALKSYTVHYIIGTFGNPFNNSAYGAVKMFIFYFHGQDFSHLGTLLQRINACIAAVFTGLLLTGVYLFLRRQISAFVFAFVALSCFVLASTIFAVYHLLVFAAFPLLMLRDDPDRPTNRAELVILCASVFVLSPKNYFFMANASIESILNPFVLAAVLLWLISAGFQGRLVESPRPARV